MGSLMHILKCRGRTTHGAPVVPDVRIRHRSFATAAATLLATAAIAFTTSVTATGRHDDARWVGTWTASPQGVAAPIQINGQTVRQIVHTSLGGERVRVRLSNAYGTSGLVIGSAHVAISTGGAGCGVRSLSHRPSAAGGSKTARRVELHSPQG